MAALTLTLAQASGEPARVRNDIIVRRQSLHSSPMPSFAEALAPQEMADLAVFLLAQRSAPSPAPTAASTDGTFSIGLKPDRLAIAHAGQAVAEFFFRDKEILRPYFANVRAPGGLKATRNHPPVAGTDATDHDTMHPGNSLAFGHQEEMGFGERVATAITEKNGGLITSSTGLKNAKTTWGQAAEWCDYSGTVEGHRLGLTLMADPKNFRPSWWHNRAFVANPFGREAMKQGARSAVTVKRGEDFHLRFGAAIHSGPEFTPAASYPMLLESTPGNAAR